MAALEVLKRTICTVFRRHNNTNIWSATKLGNARTFHNSFSSFRPCLIKYNSTWLFPVLQRSFKEERQQFKDGFFLLSLALSIVYADSVDSKENLEEEEKDESKIADQLYVDHKISELYHFLLKSKDCDDADLLWRFARAARDFSELADTSNELKKELIFEGFKSAEKAVMLDDNCFACHKWYGIMLSEVGDYLGTRNKIENSFKIRDHFLKAIELNPKDATSHYLLGVWFFTFADLPWYQKKLAATLFASPPNCTYIEAEEHFLHAESIDPGFYTANQLMLAKTYLRLGKKDSALHWINKLLLSTAKTSEDAKSISEAENLFRSL